MVQIRREDAYSGRSVADVLEGVVRASCDTISLGQPATPRDAKHHQHRCCCCCCCFSDSHHIRPSLYALSPNNATKLLLYHHWIHNYDKLSPWRFTSITLIVVKRPYKLHELLRNMIATKSEQRTCQQRWRYCNKAQQPRNTKISSQRLDRSLLTVFLRRQRIPITLKLSKRVKNFSAFSYLALNS